MLTRDFDFRLPPAAVAQRPLRRGESRLLDLDARGDRRHGSVRELPDRLQSGDLLVVNDSRVLRARLHARIDGSIGGPVEILLARRRDVTTWSCLARPGRRLRRGTRLRFGPAVTAEVIDVDPEGTRRIRFDQPIEPWLDTLGHVPLPPYIRRDDDDEDRERYQTVYAREDGSIAAPTAGLHFDTALLDAVRARGIEIAPLTLHVGLGTFRPVTSVLAHEHHVDAEYYELPSATAEAITRTRARGGRVVAVGTTVVRALESAVGAHDDPTPGPGWTELLILPGHDFRVVDRLLTNFHLPRSSLLMLVCAAGSRDRVLTAYAEAVELGYRFYSYGDAMLLSTSRGRRGPDG